MESESPDGPAQPIYDKYWRNFDVEESFWREEIRQGRLKTPRVNIFLQNYLTLRTADEVPSTNIFGIFREYAKTSSAITNFEGLAQYAAVFEEFATAKKGTREHQFLDRLEQLDVSTFQPLFLAIFRPHAGLSRQEFLQILQDIESFLVRRTVCDLTTKAYNRLIVDMITDLRADGAFSAAAIREFLLKQTAESSFWPTDDDFRTAWRDEKVYWFKRSKVRMLLEAIDTERQDAKAEKVKYADYGEKLTIEHILPQNWKEHWPLPTDIPSDAALERRERLLHSFGNLTLLNGNSLPQSAIGPWSAKVAAIWEHSKINLNGELPKYATWDEKTIVARGESLFETALILWPGPNDLRAAQRVRVPQRKAAAASVGIGGAPAQTAAERSRLDELAFFDVLSASAGAEAAERARRIAAAVRDAGLRFRPRRGAAMISLRLSDRGRRINVCHIATNGAIGFGWTKGQLEDLDLPTGLADEFYARVAARYGLKLKANGCPAGLSLVLISDNEDDFLRLVIEFATRVREAAGLSVSSAPAATETSDDEADEAETDDESDSLA